MLKKNHAFLWAAVALNSTAFAQAPAPEVEARLRYGTMDGQPAFLVQWNEENQTGLVQMALQWIQFKNEDHQAGFNLTLAQTKNFIEPRLSEGCAVTSFKGTLYGFTERQSPLSFSVQGESCRSMIEQMGQHPISFYFENIPHKTGGGSTEKLRVIIDDTVSSK